MKFFTHKIVEGKCDQLVHLQFLKYSKGLYEQKALVQGKKTKDGWNIGTSAEYANELVRAVAEEVGTDKTSVTGKIITTRDLSKELPSATMSQFAGVKRYDLAQDLSGKEIITLCDQLPNAFFGLSFKSKQTELKIKPKAPKSGKPSSGDDEEVPKADFCKIKTTNKTLAESLLVGAETAKEFSIQHKYNITEIIPPKGETDPAKMRELAIRKGTLTRMVTIDGKTTQKDYPFSA